MVYTSPALAFRSIKYQTKNYRILDLCLVVLEQSYAGTLYGREGNKCAVYFPDNSDSQTQHIMYICDAVDNASRTAATRSVIRGYAWFCSWPILEDFASKLLRVTLGQRYAV